MFVQEIYLFPPIARRDKKTASSRKKMNERDEEKREKSQPQPF
jgi:hypothetical protein